MQTKPKPVWLSEEEHTELQKLAEIQGRTLRATVARLVTKELKKELAT